jgi:Putative Ig domain
MSWTERETANNADGIVTYDSYAPSAGAYGLTINWPNSCNVTNWYELIAFKNNGFPQFVQGNAYASPLSAGFTSQTIAFNSPNTTGNQLVIDVEFHTSTPLANISVTDTNGNFYWPVLGAHTLGAAVFLCTFVCASCAAGANTITITVNGSYPFEAISIAIHEYTGVSCPTPAATGVGTAINLGGGQFYVDGAPFYGTWLTNGCTLSVNIAGGGFQGPYTITGNHGGFIECLGGPTPLPGVCVWQLNYPSAFGSFDCPYCYDNITFDSGPDVNSFSDSVTTTVNGDLLHLVAANSPWCAGVVPTGGGSPLDPDPPSIACGTPPEAAVGFPYSFQIPYTGGVAPLTFSVLSGSLPPGLSLNTSTGLISGTPTTAGKNFSYVIKVVDAFDFSAVTGTCSGSGSGGIIVSRCPVLDVTTTFVSTPSVMDIVFVDCYSTPAVMDMSYVDNPNYPHFTAFNRERWPDDERHLYSLLRRAWNATTGGITGSEPFA